MATRNNKYHRRNRINLSISSRRCRRNHYGKGIGEQLHGQRYINGNGSSSKSRANNARRANDGKQYHYEHHAYHR